MLSNVLQPPEPLPRLQGTKERVPTSLSRPLSSANLLKNLRDMSGELK